MKQVLIAVLAVSASAIAAPPVAALTSPPPRVSSPASSVYRFDVTVTGAEPGAHAPPATYTLILGEGQPGKLSVGANVPLVTRVAGGASFVRQDVGLELNLEYALRGDTVLLAGDVELSTLDPGAASGPSTIRRVRAHSIVAIAPGAPALFTSASDLASNRHYEVHVAAQRLL